MKVLQFLVFIFLVSVQHYVVNAQTYVVYEGSTYRQSYTLYIENNKKIDTTSNLSNIAFIRKWERLDGRKANIDTLFFENALSENPKLLFREFKISRTKIDSTNNRCKHFFILDTDPWKVDSIIPKDSIVLNGYFKIIDKQKPFLFSHEDPLRFHRRSYSPNTVYDDLEKPEKNKYYSDIGNTLNGGLENRKQNAIGWFTNGFKTGIWVFYKYGFLKVEEQYKKGIRDGFYTVYNKEGSVVYTTDFKNGTGEQRIYRSDGNLYHIKFFKNSEIDYTKPFTTFHPNGKPAIVYNYSNQKLIKYYNNGFLLSEQDFILKNDKVILEGGYKGYSFKISNELREKAYYKNNKEIYHTLYNYKNELVKVYTDNIRQYYNKGKLIRIESNDESHQYFKNGKVKEINIK